MGRKKVTSIKGEVLDFDLFEVKEQIRDKAPSSEVKNRENFILSKRRRGSKRTIKKMLEDQHTNEARVRESLNQQKAAKESESKQKSETPPAPTPTKSAKKKTSRKIVKK